MSQRLEKKNGQGKAAVVHSSAPVFPADRNDRWVVIGVCLVLAAMVWAVFGQTLGHEFVNYDDDQYVSENPAVTCGLS